MLELKNFWRSFCDEIFNKIPKSSFIIFSIIILGALFVRLYGLSEYDFSDDELWHLTVASQDNLWDLIQYNFREEVHPPLSFIIWHFMLKISHNDLWLRMSSIIPSLLLIPSIYLFGRLYIGRAAGYFAAIIFAFGAVPISIGSVIRAYSAMMLALTWAAIFLHKYQFSDAIKAQKKYLIYYFLCALIAIELNHAAIFTIMVLGSIALLRAIQEKNKKDFIIISAIHVFLVSCTAAYVFTLKYFYDFDGGILMFSQKDLGQYLMKYLNFFLQFLMGSEIKDGASQIINLFSILSLIIAPLWMIKDKKWQLLFLVFAPILIIFSTDYLRIYPFTSMKRNNLFMFFSVVILYGYFVQGCVNFLEKLYLRQFYKKWLEKRPKIIATAQIFIAIIFVISAMFYVIKHNVFRNIDPNCYEFIVKKSDTKLLWSKLDGVNRSDNIFVTLVRDIWTLRFKNGDKNHLKILTKNLGKFETDDFTIYFTAFPARQLSTSVSLFEYQIFFKDLFSYLQAQGNLQKIKSFTFFDIGLNNDYLTMNFMPQFTTVSDEPFSPIKDKFYFEEDQISYNLSWKIHSSNQVLDSFYFKDHDFQCGREMLILSLSPKFVRDEILDRRLTDMRKIYESEVLK